MAGLVGQGQAARGTSQGQRVVAALHPGLHGVQHLLGDAVQPHDQHLQHALRGLRVGRLRQALAHEVHRGFLQAGAVAHGLGQGHRGLDLPAQRPDLAHTRQARARHEVRPGQALRIGHAQVAQAMQPLRQAAVARAAVDVQLLAHGRGGPHGQAVAYAEGLCIGQQRSDRRVGRQLAVVIGVQQPLRPVLRPLFRHRLLLQGLGMLLEHGAVQRLQQLRPAAAAGAQGGQAMGQAHGLGRVGQAGGQAPGAQAVHGARRHLGPGMAVRLQGALLQRQPYALVVAGHGHAGRVAAGALQPLQRVGDQVHAHIDGRPGIRRPGGGREAGNDAGHMEAAADHQAAPAFGQGGADLGGHVGLAGHVLGIHAAAACALLALAQQLAEGQHAGKVRLGRGVLVARFVMTVPPFIEVAAAAGLDESGQHVGRAPRGLVGQQGFRRAGEVVQLRGLRQPVGIGQVDEAHGAAQPRRLAQGHPFGREGGKGHVATAAPVFLGRAGPGHGRMQVGGQRGTRLGVLQRGQQGIELGRAFDEHMGGLELAHQRAQVVGAARAVVAHGHQAQLRQRRQPRGGHAGFSAHGRLRQIPATAAALRAGVPPRAGIRRSGAGPRRRP